MNKLLLNNIRPDMLLQLDSWRTANLQSISDAQAKPVAYVSVTVKQETTDKCNNAANTNSRWGRLGLAIMT